MEKCYKQLSFEWRTMINMQLETGIKPVAIVMVLNRSASTHYLRIPSKRLGLFDGALWSWTISISGSTALHFLRLAIETAQVYRSTIN